MKIKNIIILCVSTIFALSLTSGLLIIFQGQTVLAATAPQAIHPPLIINTQPSQIFESKELPEGVTPDWWGAVHNDFITPQNVSADDYPTPSPDWTQDGYLDTSGTYPGQFGYAVESAGDVDGDGYDDVIVSAPIFFNNQTSQGRAYVYHGSASGLASSYSWTAGDTGSDGYAHFAYSAGTAGDFNCDGYDDVIVGAYGGKGSYAHQGYVHVYFGSPSGLSSSPGWVKYGSAAWERFGSSVGTAGDVNGDHCDDIIIGAVGYNNGDTIYEGAAFVYHGGATPDTTHDWMVEADQSHTELGNMVGTAGDVNGDGHDDVIMRLYTYNSQGVVWVYHGSSSGLTTGDPNWYITAGGYNINGISTAGSVNGDIYDDVIIGYRDNKAEIYHGSISGLSTAPDWTNDLGFSGTGLYFNVSDTGDTNNDGYDDVLVAATDYTGDYHQEGYAALFFGSSSGVQDEPAWTFTGGQASSGMGLNESLGAAGDVNNDNYGDVLIGIPFQDIGGVSYVGRVHAFYGEAVDPISGLIASNNSPKYIGETVTFTATISTGDYVDYDWDFGDASSGSGANPTHVYGEAGSFTATVTATNVINQQVANTNVTINDVPISGLAASNDGPTVLGNPTTLSATVTAGTGISYTWDLGDGMTALGSRVEYTYSAVGDYTAVVTATNGTNLLTDTTNINVIETPISGLTASNDSPTELGDTTTLTATITGGDNVNYMWDFGDGKSDSEAIVTNIYSEIGTYTATVTATNTTNSLTANTTVTIQEWQPGGNIYVEPAGICGGLSPCFDKIQDAVDAAFDQNEILVANGTYTDTNTFGGDTQLVYITKTLAIKGGYNSDFSTRDPDTYPTILDAQSLGRGVTIESPSATYPILDGLIIKNGHIGQFTGNQGGGILVKEFARPTIRNCEIYDNYGWLGGGVSLHSIPHVNIYNNRIHDNHGYSGGTVYAYFADDLNVSNNLIYNNDSESTSMYGGVLLNRSDNAYIYGNEIFDNTDMQGITINFSHGTVLEQNEFYGNRSAIDQNFGSGGTRVYDNHIYNNTYAVMIAGDTTEVVSNTIHNEWQGIYLSSGYDIEIKDNDIYGHTAIDGGGIYIGSSSNVLVENNRIHDNSLTGNGGGLKVSYSDHISITHNLIYSNTAYYGSALILQDSQDINLTNNFIAQNPPGNYGEAVRIYNSTATLKHNTIASNKSIGTPAGIQTTGSSQLTMTNNIIADHYYGLLAYGASAVVNSTLWGAGEWANLWDYTGSTITITNNYWGDPGFVEPGNFDYHIGTNSAGIDLGADAGIPTDIDYESRPYGAKPDIGADELQVDTPILGLLATNNSPTIFGVPTNLTATITSGSAVSYEWDFGDGESGNGAVVSHIYPYEGDFSATVTATNYYNSAFTTTPVSITHRYCGAIINDNPTIYTSIQDAVDASSDPSDVIKVNGVCTGTNSTAAVNVNKTVTIRGGYNLDFTTWDPENYQTIVDGENARRVFSLTGPSPTLEYLEIRNGNAVGGWGGGILINYGAAGTTIRHCNIHNNTIGHSYGGGGIFVGGSDAIIEDNLIHHNHSNGIRVYDRDNVIIAGNKIYSNTPATGGTGIDLYGFFRGDNANIYNNEIYDNDGGAINISSYTNVTVTQNSIHHNYSGIGSSFGDGLKIINNQLISHENASSYMGGGIRIDRANDLEIVGNIIDDTQIAYYNYGGGIYITGCPGAEILNNRISNNIIDAGMWSNAPGGGLLIINSDNVKVDGNHLYGNSARNGGAGFIQSSSNLTITNNIFEGNTTTRDSGALYFTDASAQLLHNTFASNSGGSSAGVYTADASEIDMTNTILVNHTVGISVTSGCTATLESTLWGSGAWTNGVDYLSAGNLVTGTLNIWGEPAFQNPAGHNYHLTTASAALDTGIDAGITTDIDGDTRPIGSGHDIGADEVVYDVINVPPGGTSSTMDGVLDFTAPSALTDTLTITYTALVTSSHATGDFSVGGVVFHLDATDSNGDPVTTFSPPISLTVSYDESALPDNMDEADLDMYRYDAGLSDWVALPVINRDLDADTITVELDHLSEFAILAPVDRDTHLFLPLVFRN